MLSFDPNPPAHVRGDHSKLGLGDPAGEGEPELRHVRDLGGRPDGELAGGGSVRGDGPAGLDSVRDQSRYPVPLLHQNGGVRERPVDVPHPPMDPREALVRAELLVDQRHAVLERRLDVGHCWQLLQVQIDGLRGVEGLGPALGHHHSQGFACVPGLVL